MNGITVQQPEYPDRVSDRLRQVATPSKVVFETPVPGTMAEVFREIQYMFKTHWEEVALYKDVRPLDLDTDFYEEMSRRGKYVGVCARQDGAIVGYTSYFLAAHPHYKTWKVAKCDALFILPKYRTIFVSVGLLRHAESYLKELGVNSIVSGTKKHKDLERLFNFLGYEAIETLHEKVL